ncbi:MAG: 30S ribosomal protein S5 [Verrucomicrobiota bacterium]|nr:30S ribosomal protein S5 [Verrucomicrobiota bacterium]
MAEETKNDNAAAPAPEGQPAEAAAPAAEKSAPESEASATSSAQSAPGAAASSGGRNQPPGRGGDRRGGQGQQRRGRPGGNRPQRFNDRPDDGLTEKVIFINRSTKVVKGGRRFGFSALVVVGDQEGKVGLGFGKAGEVVESIRKGSDNARAEQVSVSLLGDTLPHEVYSVYDGARVLLRPASPGTGIIAGKTARAVLEAAGVKNVLSKSLGSNNPANVAKATLQGLRQLRLERDVMKNRGLEKAAS